MGGWTDHAYAQPQQPPHIREDAVARGFEARARRARVITAYLAGTPASTIATTEGISANRVHQIIRTTPELQEERARRQTEHHAHQLARATTWSKTHLGRSIQQGAIDLDMDPDQLRTLLGDRIAAHEPRPNTQTPTITDHDIIQALTTFAVLTGGQDLRKTTYDTLAKTHGWPSSATITHRHGRWTTALTHAGHHALPVNRRPMYTDEELLDWVVAYFRSAQTPWTFERCKHWLAGQEGAPSGALLIRRFGTWHAVIGEHLEHAAQRASDPDQ